jgi:cell division ATPase FtsA
MSLATPDLLDLIAARAARDHGMALAEESELTGWTEAADRAIRELIREGVPFSSDDICARVGRPYHANAVGAYMKRAVQAGRVVKLAETVQSTRVAARGRWLPLYVGVVA